MVMARSPVTCSVCGGSGVVPDELHRECLAVEDATKRKLLERHLYERHNIFEAVDAILACDRLGYMGTGDSSVSDLLLTLHRLHGKIHDAYFAGDEARALEMLCIAAAEIVWVLEGAGYPEKADVLAMYRKMGRAVEEDEDGPSVDSGE